MAKRRRMVKRVFSTVDVVRRRAVMRSHVAVTAMTLALASPAAAQEQAVPPPSPAPITLELGGHLGVVGRADDPPDLEPVDPTGLDLEASAFIAPDPSYSIGLSFQQLSLGREQSAVGSFGTFEVRRDASALWGALRLNLDAGERGGVGLFLGPGLVWQRLDVSGVAGLLDRPTTFTCSGTGSAGFGLRAGVSGWVAAGAGFALTAGAGAELLSLSTDPLDGCARGAGTALMLGLRLGVAYRLDVRQVVR